MACPVMAANGLSAAQGFNDQDHAIGEIESSRAQLAQSRLSNDPLLC